MKFDIRITFDGLYLLAVEQKPKKLLHALLINFGEDVPYGCDCSHGEAHGATNGGTAANGGSGKGNGNGHAAGNGHDGDAHENEEPPRHYPMLYFDAAHLALNDPDRQRMTGHPFGVSLKDRVLRLEEIGGPTPANVALDPKVIGLKQISKAKAISHRVLEQAPSRIIAGRVTLGSGQPLPVTQSESFDVIPPGATNPNQQVTIATRVEWEIAGVEVNDPTGAFPLELFDIEDEKRVVKTHVLRPVTIFEREPKTKKVVEKDVIQLHVYCAGARDLPGGAVIHAMERGTPMPHLAGFFQLFPKIGVPTLRFSSLSKTGSTEQCTGMQVDVK